MLYEDTVGESRKSECLLKKVFLNNYVVSNRIMDFLPATYVSLVTWLCEIELDEWEKNKYLDPIRDMGQYEQWIKDRIVEGCWVVLVGKDVKQLMTRIKSPVKYWSENRYAEYLTIWLVVVPKSGFGESHGNVCLDESGMPVEFQTVREHTYAILLGQDNADPSRHPITSEFLFPSWGLIQQQPDHGYYDWLVTERAITSHIHLYFFVTRSNAYRGLSVALNTSSILSRPSQHAITRRLPPLSMMEQVKHSPDLTEFVEREFEAGWNPIPCVMRYVTVSRHDNRAHRPNEVTTAYSCDYAYGSDYMTESRHQPFVQIEMMNPIADSYVGEPHMRIPIPR